MRADLSKIQINGNEKEVEMALEKLAREQTKHLILKDVLFDINVCKLMGIEYKDYIKDIINMLSEFIKEE